MEIVSKMVRPREPALSAMLRDWLNESVSPSLVRLEKLRASLRLMIGSLPDGEREENLNWLSESGRKTIAVILGRYDSVLGEVERKGDAQSLIGVEAARMALLAILGRFCAAMGRRLPDFLEEALHQSLDWTREVLQELETSAKGMTDKLKACEQLAAARESVKVVQAALPADLEETLPGRSSLDAIEERLLLREMFLRREAREAYAGDDEVARSLDEGILGLFDELSARKETSIFSVRPLQTAGEETELFVSRDETTRLREVLALTDGGNFAVAGARGIGKSTLLNHIQRAYSNEYISVHISAPRKYDTLEFFHVFFIRLCEAVDSFLSPPDEERTDEEVFYLRRYARTPLSARPWFLIGLLLFISVVTGGLNAAISVPWWAYPIAVAYAAAVTWWWFYLRKRSSARAVRERLATLLERRVETRWGYQVVGILERTRQHLADLYYIQRASQGLTSAAPTVQVGVAGGPLTGGISLPLGQAETSGSEREKRAYTLPLITEAVRDYIQSVTAVKPFIVVFDDIDKMAVAEADSFLRDLRTVFSIKHCYFFISGPPQYLEQLLTGLIAADDKGEPDTVIDHVLTLRGMDSQSLEEVILKRMAFRGLSGAVEEGTVALIAKLADGNPRNAVRFFAGAFRKWIREGGASITPVHALTDYLDMVEEGVMNTGNAATLSRVFHRLDDLAAEEARYTQSGPDGECKRLQAVVAGRAWETLRLSELERSHARSTLRQLAANTAVRVDQGDPLACRVLEELARSQILTLHDGTCNLSDFGRCVSERLP